MNNLKTVRELRKILEFTQNTINDLTPEPDITQANYEPQFELGTRYINYINGIRHVYKYVKVDAGIVGTDVETDKELRVIYYKWI